MAVITKIITYITKSYKENNNIIEQIAHHDVSAM